MTWKLHKGCWIMARRGNRQVLPPPWICCTNILAEVGPEWCCWPQDMTKALPLDRTRRCILLHMKLDLNFWFPLSSLIAPHYLFLGEGMTLMTKTGLLHLLLLNKPWGCHAVTKSKLIHLERQHEEAQRLHKMEVLAISSCFIFPPPVPASTTAWPPQSQQRHWDRAVQQSLLWTDDP